MPPLSLLSTLRALGPRGVRQLLKEIVISSRAVELTYTREDGKTIVIPLLPMPVVLAGRDIPYLRSICLTLEGAFLKAAAVRALMPEVRAILPVDEPEEEWLALAPPGKAPLLSRWDMNIDPA